MPDTLADWLAYLESLHPKTIALGLERVAQVKQRLNLQPGFPIITVGGTNGKGSVCAMLEAILHAAGYRVGCYTSPHLLDYNERVRIAKKQASDAELCAAFEIIEQARIGLLPPPCITSDLAAMPPSRMASSSIRGRVGAGIEAGQDGAQHFYPHPSLPPARGKELTVESAEVPLTYFEFGTLAAMQLFVERKVEVAILEVGLGGRLDAVNVFDPDCAVVASVDMDHMDYLGDTREKIAYEKAGIFRKDKVAVFGDRDMPEQIALEAQRIGAELWRLGGEFGHDGHSLTLALSQRERGQNPVQWDYRGPAGMRTALPFPALRGAYQLNNASTALAALDALKNQLTVSMEAVRRGLVEVVLPGRFQVLSGAPQIILDVAHNPHAARALAGNLAAMPPCRKVYAVFSMLRDKDIAGVARALDGQVDVWMVAGINAPRGMAAAELAEALRDAGVTGEVRTYATVADALKQASIEAAENDRIAVFGSFYTVAEAMRARGLRYG